MLLVVGSCAVLAAIILPVFAQTKGGGPARPGSRCLNNLKQLGLGEIQYAADNNDRFPSRDTWMDAIYPYVKNRDLYRCPKLAPGAWGYAFNGALDRAKTPTDLSVPMIYDSVNPSRNASDLVASLPSPGRHGGMDYTVRVDGSVKGIKVP